MNIAATTRYAFWLLLLALIVAPWPLGSNRDWAWPALMLLLGGASLLALYKAPLPEHRHSTVVITAFIALMLWMTMQLWGVPGLFSPLSFDRMASRNELLKTLMLLALFLSIVQLATSRQRLEVLLYALVLTGLAQALLGGIQQLMFDLPRARGSFPNPNHFAGYLEVTICLAIGLMIARQPVSENTRFSLIGFVTGPQGRLRMIIIMMVIALVMSRSRMGNIALFSSVLLTALIAFYYSRSMNRYTLGLLTSILLLDLFIIGNYFGIDRLQERFAQASTEASTRIDLHRYHADMVGDRIFVGSGAGSYETVFAQYRDASISRKATHAENDYAEFLIELGLLGSLPLVVILITGIHAQLKLLGSMTPPFERGIAFGCLAGTLSIMIHGIAEVNLQIPANSIMFLITLALPVAMLQQRVTT